MYFRFCVLLCVSCTITLTASHPNVNVRNNLPATTTINATLIDQNGKDLSSSFTKKVFYYNTTEDAVNGDKDAQAGAARIINTCGALRGLFIESSCSYETGVLGSIRLYSYTCKNYKKGVRNKKAGIMEETTYAGSCNAREICVNGRIRKSGEQSEGGMTAFCINMDAFSAANEAILPDVSGATLTTLLTSSDMETPLLGGRLDVETETVTSDGQEQDGPSEDCLNCTSLTTEEFPSSIESNGVELQVWLEYWIAGLTGMFLLVFFGI